MADDNVVKFTGPSSAITFSQENSKPVLIVMSDGTKFRGRDRRAITELEKDELLEIIDGLVALVKR